MTWIRRFFAWLGRAFGRLTGGSAPLCDTCRYDYGDACRRPERPNARICSDYQHK